MVDLRSQYKNIENEVNEAIMNVVRNASFINGPDVKAFAAELASFLQVKHVIPCANGTDALQIAMMALGLEPGDEVITPTFTYAATCEVIALLNLTPVFVDCDPDTFNIDVEKIEAAISPRTKAIVPVHLYGQCADMEQIMNLAQKHHLFVIEDTAQAIGAQYQFKNGTSQFAGTIGDIGATSFFPSKNLGCYGDGGALFTNNDELALKMSQIANHGQTRLYYHDIVGVNSRLDTIQAAILRVKLKKLNDYAAARNHAADFYDQAFQGLPHVKIPGRAKNSTHVFHQYTLTLNNIDRDEFSAELEIAGVPNKVYYPIPQHLQKAYNLKNYQEGDLPVSESLSKKVISLPMHTELDEEQLSFITSKVLTILKSK